MTAHNDQRHSSTSPGGVASCISSSHPVHPDPDSSVGLAAVQHHLYDAQGERGLKGLGTITEFYVNGETKGYGASLGNYVRYVSGYFVVDGHGRVSKHYYAGAERVVSRLAGEVAGYLESEDLEGEQLSTLRSRQQRDVQAAIKTWDLQIFPFLNYPKPTDNCSLYPSGSEEHKQCLCDQQNTCTEVLYWYHPDHLGSSTFLSDAAGVPYQFVQYLPFGELFTEQRAAEWSTPYLFNAKELDTETGLYYYGARYYDPRVSMWWGVDPLAGEMPAWSSYAYTFQNPVRYIDPTGMIPEEGDSPKNEYIRFKNSEGKWVTVEISKLGGDEYDVIRTQHGNVPDKGSWVETTTHYNSDRMGRIEPGQFGERPPDASLEFFDISDLIPTKGGAKFTLGLAMGGFFKKSGKELPSRFGQIRGGIKKAQELTKSNHNLKLLDGKRIDLKGRHPLSKGHYNKVTKEQFGYPHVYDPTHPGGVRAPNANDYIEIFNLFK
jgi:RHS repeat-associated protein